MRAVVQRVSSAFVTVDGRRTGEIGRGLLVFLGIAPEDGEAEVRWIADKVANLRIFEDDAGKMNRSVLEIEGEVQIVSQFTLYGDARKGRRPSFVRAAQGAEAEKVYQGAVDALRELGITVATGEFGAMMDVALTNTGPVTILLDSDKQF
jgi:D-tyrosyl-tRNA(Tyr) deacylase